jgi:hypothetical protein
MRYDSRRGMQLGSERRPAHEFVAARFFGAHKKKIEAFRFWLGKRKCFLDASRPENRSDASKIFVST